MKTDTCVCESSHIRTCQTAYKTRTPWPIPQRNSHSVLSLFPIRYPLLTEILQSFLQLLPREEDAALDRSQGNIQGLSDLIILVPAHEHGEGHFQFLVQALDRGRNLLDLVSAIRIVEARVIHDIQIVEINILIHYRLCPDDLMVIIDENITHDGQNPSLEIDIIDKFFLVVQDLQRCILHQILSIIPVRCQSERKIHHILLQAQ